LTTNLTTLFAAPRRGSTTGPVAVMLAVLAVGACRAPRGRGVGRSDPSSGAAIVADARAEMAAPPLAVAAATTATPTPDVGASLQAEEGERNPRSDTVTIKLLVDPPKRAHAFWGMKDMGVTPLEIKRPRGSGPVDLAIRAPGYLTIHTRAFTDRDDRITIRLVPDAEAPRTFGYRTANPP
jgi:hypothetical protein